MQRRSFWGLLTNQNEDDEYFQTDYHRHIEPGMQVMEDLAEALQQRSRPPETKKLAAAFNDLFISVSKSMRKQQGSKVPIRLTEYYTTHLLTTFNYLLEQKEAGQNLEDIGMNGFNLISALRILSQAEIDPESNADVAELSSKIYQALTTSATKDETKKSPVDGVQQPIPAESYVTILTLSRRSEDALTFIDHWRGTLLQPSTLLIHVIRGLAREGREEQAFKILESRLIRKEEMQLKDMTPEHLKASCESLLIHSATSNYTYLTKQLAALFKSSSWEISVPSLRSLLAFSIRINDLDWGKQWFQELTDVRIFFAGRSNTNPPWTSALLWLAANGHGTEEMERLVTQLLNDSKNSMDKRGPSIASVNALVSFANSRNNPFAAERFLAMGLRFGLAPDGETFLRQMEGRLQAGDVEGAIACYKELDLQEQVPDDLDLPGLNKLLLALCSAKNVDYNLILALLDKLLARKSSLHPETVATLCELFIGRGELGEATDLLKRARLDLYSKRQRELISKALFHLVTGPKLKTLHAWQAYELLVKAFPEIPVQDRTTLMNSFFDRDQSDMACMVFGHMRQSQDRKKRPTADTYVECFEGLCRHPEEDSLQLVHNMLKIDTHVDPSTKLLNGLMLAYMNSFSPGRSIEYWDEILNSQEGPTYNSIVIVLQSCQRAAGGDRVARVIMRRLASLEIDITQEIYAAYLGALTHHGDIETALDLVSKMQADVGLSPDSFVFVFRPSDALPFC
jgi:pentatricopeptide repeat protein